MGKMSVTSLQALILDDIDTLDRTDDIPVSQAVGRCLAKDILAPINVPVFTRSAVDGYALNSQDTSCALPDTPVTLDIIEKVTTGMVPKRRVERGEATLVTTGAMLPQGADAVALVEHVSVQDGVVVLEHSVRAGDNISLLGEDIRFGELVLAKEHIVRLVDVAVLSALGIVQIPVIRRPKVAIFSTGDELVTPGEPLRPAQVYDANAYLLEAFVRESGGDPVRLGTIGDRIQEVERLLNQTAHDKEFDVIVTTGGTGASLLVLEGQDIENIHDLIPGAIVKEGQLKSHGLLMTPGKPTAYGEIAGVPVFALAGWPYSALMTFQLFVRPAIRKMSGLPPFETEPEVRARLCQELTTEAGVRKYFQVRLKHENEEIWAEPLLSPPPPSAARTMHQMLQGTGYVFLDGVSQFHVNAGEWVQVAVDDPKWS